MELIQNHVYNREGKKWKQRWAVLKKVAPKTQSTSNDAFYYLFLYKDGVHAKEGKEKQVLPLIDFCGLDSLKQYDKAKNVLVIITATQTAFLSFEDVPLRDQWVRILIDHFGEAVSYDISIPDKQKLKAGQATLRLYPSFFSIITSKSFRCLNRWYTNDILRYSAEDETQFMFEIGPPNKSKGLLVNLIVSNAEDISKKFAEYDRSDQTMIPRDFHGSSLLDELGQAKRNAGDQNFIRRAILRASDRMRKKIRDRSRTNPGGMKRPGRVAMSTSMSEEAKFRSIDRKTSPDIGVQINDATMEQTIMLRSVSVPTSPLRFINRQISNDEPAPQLPKKRSPNQSSSSQVSAIEKRLPAINDENAKSVTKVRTLLKPRSKTTSDIPVMSTEATVNSNPKPSSSRSEEQLDRNLLDSKDGKPNEAVLSIKKKEIKSPQSDIIFFCNKNDTFQTHQRKSTDSPVNNNVNMYKQPANPAKYAISKKKRPSMKSNSQKTPTPPPRSPVSLGLTAAQPNIFNFPPTNDVIEDTPDCQGDKKCERKSSFLTEIDREVKRRTMNSEDFSDDAFTYSSEPSPANSYHSYYSHSESYIKNEPAYGNIDSLRKDSSDDSTSNNLTVREPPRRWRRGSTKHLSDPLGVEQWTVATGDGQPIKNLLEFAIDRHDYLNVKGTQNHNDDSDHDSYVNVSSSGPGKPELERSFGKRKKNIPEPLRLQTSFKNDFEKYDDDDTNIYHPVGAIDNDSSSSTGCISSYRRGGGSYEDMNMKNVKQIKNSRNHQSDYLNLMSPAPRLNSSKLNYVLIGSTGGTFSHSKSVSTSPIRLSARSPIETYNKSDYTQIDSDRTAALSRSMVEHRQQPFKQSGNKTPTKNAK